jgi:hypothetical protein
MSSFHDVLAICIRQFVCFQATVCFLCSGVNPSGTKYLPEPTPMELGWSCIATATAYSRAETRARDIYDCPPLRQAFACFV